MYFHLRKLHFSAGAGFIRIDLPLLLSVSRETLFFKQIRKKKFNALEKLTKL